MMKEQNLFLVPEYADTTDINWVSLINKYFPEHLKILTLKDVGIKRGYRGLFEGEDLLEYLSEKSLYYYDQTSYSVLLNYDVYKIPFLDNTPGPYWRTYLGYEALDSEIIKDFLNSLSSCPKDKRILNWENYLYLRWDKDRTEVFREEKLAKIHDFPLNLKQVDTPLEYLLVDEKGSALLDNSEYRRSHLSNLINFIKKI